MSFARDLNTVTGTGNPVQMQDLSYLWEALSALALTYDANAIRIISGFAISGTNIGGGVICFQNNAYILSANTATVGQYLYAQQSQTEQRVYEDGATRYVYNRYVVRASNSPTSEGIGTLIGQATADNLNTWKAPRIGEGAIARTQISPNSIGSLSFERISTSVSFSLVDGTSEFREIDTGSGTDGLLVNECRFTYGNRNTAFGFFFNTSRFPDSTNDILFAIPRVISLHNDLDNIVSLVSSTGVGGNYAQLRIDYISESLPALATGSVSIDWFLILRNNA